MTPRPIDANDSNRYFDAIFSGQRVMAIMRGYDPAQTVARCELAWSVGINVVEIPIQSLDAVASLRAAVSAARDVGRVVGVGTVVSPDQVTTAAREGAAFAVAPGLNPAIVTACLSHGIPHLAGVATASEIQSATGLGLTWLKAFPAQQLTPGWFAAVRAPFPHLQLVATGGVGVESAQQYLDAGARAVAVGSALGERSSMERLAAINSEATEPVQAGGRRRDR